MPLPIDCRRNTKQAPIELLPLWLIWSILKIYRNRGKSKHKCYWRKFGRKYLKKQTANILYAKTATFAQKMYTLTTLFCPCRWARSSAFNVKNVKASLSMQLILDSNQSCKRHYNTLSCSKTGHKTAVLTQSTTISIKKLQKRGKDFIAHRVKIIICI